MDFIPNKQTNQYRLSKEMKKKLRKGDEDAEKLLTYEIRKKSKGFMAAGGKRVGKLIFWIGTIDSYSYRQAIKYYLDDIKALSPSNSTLYFQQDNAPCHTSKEKKIFFLILKLSNFGP